MTNQNTPPLRTIPATERYSGLTALPLDATGTRERVVMGVGREAEKVLKEVSNDRS